jgi:hypothetical protein
MHEVWHGYSENEIKKCESAAEADAPFSKRLRMA